jgi:tetratricopeptide (TPR) repeat protein
MDTIASPAASAKQVAPVPASHSEGQLWQVPIFFTGVVALVTAFLVRPFLQPDPVRNLHKDLAEARRLLHRKDSDPQAFRKLAQRAVDNSNVDPQRAGEACLLLACACMRIAETSEPAAAAKDWQLAQRYLQEAEHRGVPPDEMGRLHYGQAKVGFYLQDDPQRVVTLLKANVDGADDKAEAYSLLTQAYLRLTPPNYKEALLANETLRLKTPNVTEDVLAPAKLAGAKLLLSMTGTEEARKTLEKLGAEAPPAVLAEAHLLLAARYQEDGKWAEAAELWRGVLADPRLPLAEPGGALYNLGVCYRRLEQTARAVEAWEQCLERGKGEEVPAAALGLAELRLADVQSEKALKLFERAVAQVRTAKDWNNALVDLPHLRDLFEAAIQTYRKTNRYELAGQTAVLYERVAVSPKAQALRADLSTDWAHHHQEQAHAAKDARTREKDESAARELFRQAAEAHAECARLLEGNEQNDHLWFSAVCSFDGQDYATAVEKMVKLLDTEANPDRQGEGWFKLGESCRNLKNQDAAAAAYRKCIEIDTRYQYQARYQLAMASIEKGEIDEAVKQLERNLDLLHRNSDPEAQVKSLFKLCELHYARKNYRQVVRYLEGSLDRFPPSPEGVKARFQLADSYRQLAGQENMNAHIEERMSPETRDHYLEEHRHQLEKASKEFSTLEEQLSKPELQGMLTVKQQVEVPFIVAQCRFDLGQYRLALQKYEELAALHGDRPEALRALGGTVSCYAALNDLVKLRQRLDEIQARLPRFNFLSEADRQQWRDWVTRASQGLPQRSSERVREPEITIHGQDSGVRSPDSGVHSQKMETRGYEPAVPESSFPVLQGTGR